MSIIQKISIKKLLLLGISSIIIFGFLFKTATDTQKFIDVIRNVTVAPLLLAFLITLPFPLMSTLRWWFILRSAGHSLPFKKIFWIIIASGPLIIVPGRLGDLARSHPFREKIPVHRSIATILFEKVIDIMILLTFSGIGFITIGYKIYGLLLLLLAASVLPGLFITKKISTFFGLRFSILTKINSAFEILEDAKKHKKALILGILSSTGNWFLSILQVYFLFHSFQAVVPMMAIFAYLPLSIFIGLIPISIAGIGTRDSAIVTFFTPYASTAQSLAMGIGYSLFGYFLFVLIGLPFFFRYLRKEFN